uniref:Macaca fascicularis brain cDNA clone: QflA-23561, similar to human chromosome 10 open reading frame 107 (C10orf107), mRNA, RefSeq: NM_173554.1 n=1 Tax=Macaca fascicularis TaxID=9541 RepID=I7GMT2_MACFA|nr:unnamed protein product [Macaca fascicularis]
MCISYSLYSGRHFLNHLNKNKNTNFATSTTTGFSVPNFIIPCEKGKTFPGLLMFR